MIPGQMIRGQGSSRRFVLGALPLVAATLAGCSWTRSVPGPVTTPDARTTDDVLRASATQAEQRLLAAYDSAILAHPSIMAMLRVVRAHHAEHADHLGSAATGAPAAGPAPAVTDRAASQQATVAALVTLERQTAVALRAQCLDASVYLAPLLASICAAETAHVDLLAPLSR